MPVSQLSFDFLHAGQHVVPSAPKSLEIADAPKSEPVTLRRIDATRNMARFYALEVERDLLGSVVLARRWGRIGKGGKIRLDEYPGEREALAALAALVAAKKKRGYSLHHRAPEP
jgi:predicted DNA-binding WGR domain protein